MACRKFSGMQGSDDSQVHRSRGPFADAIDNEIGWDGPWLGHPQNLTVTPALTGCAVVTGILKHFPPEIGVPIYTARAWITLQHPP